MLFERPLIPLSIAFAAGCLLGMLTSAPPYPATAMAAAAAAAALVMWVRGQRGWGMLMLAVLLAGAARTAAVQAPGANDISVLADVRGFPVVDGYIASDPDVRPDRISFLLHVTDIASLTDVGLDGRISVNILRDALEDVGELEYGQMVRLQGRVQRPDGARSPGGFSRRAYLARQGVFAEVWIARNGDFKKLTFERGIWSVEAAQDVRRALHGLLHSRIPERHAGLVSGMLLGSYSMVPEDLIDSFTRSGTLHLLAASGFNCALIVFIFWRMLLRPLSAPRSASLLLVMLLVVFYILMVGGKPSILRAGVGAVLFLSAMAVGRPAHMANVLFGTGLILLIWNPLSLADVGFQLSFAAVAAIISFVPLLMRLFRPFKDHKGRMPLSKRAARLAGGHLFDVAAVTAAATLATLPILLHYFNRLSLVSLPANMAVAFLAELLFISGVAFGLLFWVPFVGWVLEQAVEILAGLVDVLVTFSGTLPWAEMNVAGPGTAGILIYYAALAGLWWTLRGRAAPAPLQPQENPFS